MKDFDHLSLKQILSLTKILNRYTIRDIVFVQRKYSEQALNFQQSINFLKRLELIKLNKQKIVPSNSYLTIIKQANNTELLQQLVSEYLIQLLLVNRNYYSEYVRNYLSCFDSIDEELKIVPTPRMRIKHSGIRNLLIELGVVIYDQIKDEYLIRDKYIFDVLNLRIKSTI